MHADVLLACDFCEHTTGAAHFGTCACKDVKTVIHLECLRARLATDGPRRARCTICNVRFHEVAYAPAGFFSMLREHRGAVFWEAAWRALSTAILLATHSWIGVLVALPYLALCFDHPLVSLGTLLLLVRYSTEYFVYYFIVYYVIYAAAYGVVASSAHARNRVLASMLYVRGESFVLGGGGTVDDDEDRDSHEEEPEETE